MQSANTPGVSEQMQWGWSQPGQAPDTAGDHHTQTGFLARPVQGHGPPMGPVRGATGAPGGLGRDQGRGGHGSSWQNKSQVFYCSSGS